MLQRVERHIVTKTDKNWKQCDHLCFLTKNLYNSALYRIRQYFAETEKYLSYYDIQKEFQNTEQTDYRSVQTTTAQQTLMLIDKAHKSFFAALRSFKKDKNRFKASPKPPQYKDKIYGRYVFTMLKEQAILDNGRIRFPKRTGLLPIKTSVTALQQVRIVPQSNCYVIEVVYKKEANLNENLKESNVLAIDLGVNNLATVVSNQPGIAPILISGKALKSMNQYYNKKLAKLRSALPRNQKSSKQILKLHHKRNCKVSNFLHHASKQVIAIAEATESKTIVIGYNEGWKQDINIGARNNQKFVFIPFLKLIQQIQYKAEEIGISVVLNEEAYTSKCSALDLEPIQKHAVYLGKRNHRGLFKSTSALINSDVNGALNIGRKVFGDAFVPADTGFMNNPVAVNCLQSLGACPQGSSLTT